MNEQGELLMDEYRKLLNEKTKLVAVTHISNALGTVNPVNDPPTLTVIPDPAAILEDAPEQMINLAGISAGGGVRLASPGSLSLSSLSAQGLVSLEAADLQQAPGGGGIVNNLGPVELVSTGGDVGSGQSPLQVTLTNTANLNISSSGSVTVNSGGELPLGAVLAPDTITISSGGALVDAGRNATTIGDGSLNLQAATINLQATARGLIDAVRFVSSASSALGWSEGSACSRIAAAPAT
mgnify:CR=1 FL=1